MNGFTQHGLWDISKFDAFVHPNDHAILNMDVNHPAISILKTFARLNDF